jgi:hypothetical protein
MRSLAVARLAPLTGIAFVAFAAAVVLLEGGEPAGGATRAEIADYWLERSDTALLSVFLAAAAAVCLLGFAASLRVTLRAAEPGEASASAVAFAGATVAAAGLLFSAATALAASDAAEQRLVEGTATLNVLAESGWVPITGGLAAMLLAAGLGGIRSGALPRGLAWSAAVLGLAFVTPAGVAAFLLTPVWVVATSIVLYRAARGRSPSAARALEPSVS